ncbi:sema domain protein, partial [Ostertagia ostertagi]
YAISSVLFSDNIFTRGDLDYRNLVLDANSASLYVGARGRIFRLWAYNVNDTSENLYADLRVSVPPAELSECRALGNSAEECQPSTRFMALTDNKERLYVLRLLRYACRDSDYLTAVTLTRSSGATNRDRYLRPGCNRQRDCRYKWGNPSELPSVYSGIRTGMAGENHLDLSASSRRQGKGKPQFVGSFDVGEHVYFFFREIAIESGGPERSVYSRVARVCKRIGGRVCPTSRCGRVLGKSHEFVSSQAVTRVETSDDTLFYATMSTSETAFVTSAICVFSFKSINQLFHHGFFVDPNSPNWLPLPADAVPEHRPGTCVSNSHSLSDSDLALCKISSPDGRTRGMPILATRDVIFTHIAVDVRSEQNVIFALDGRSNTLWKVSHWREGNSWKWLELEKREIGAGGPIKAMTLLPGEFLYFASRSAVTQFTLAACSMHSSCALCAVDPYCSWHVARSACYPREKAHGQSLGWISSWAGRGSSECSASAKPRAQAAYPGDTVHLVGAPGAVWKRDGNNITPSSRLLFTDAGGLVIMEVSREDNADYECFLNGRQMVKYRLVVDHEECTKPRSVQAYKSCQREWCKKADQYKAALADWHDAKRRN